MNPATPAYGHPITPAIRQKLNVLKAKIGTNELDAWGTEFVKNITRDGLEFLSVKQMSTMTKMFDKLFGKERPKDEVVRGKRISAIRGSGGYQLYVDHKAVGSGMSRNEAEIICTWLELCIDSLEFVLKQPKPQIAEE